MSNPQARRSPDARFALALARAFGGALIFGIPILMTMEMWTLGASMPRGRMAILVISAIPLLVGLSAVSGLERTLRLKHDALDAFVAIAVGTVAAVAILLMLGIVTPSLTLGEVVGMITLQAIPGSIGALLATSQLAKGDGDEEDDAPDQYLGYGWELFLMVVGALFLAFNIAPTEEVILIAMRMSPWHTVVAMLVSLALMHAFVYAVEFSGQATVQPGTPFASVFTRYTVVGYALVLAVSAFMLWTFGRLDGVPGAEALAIVVALGMPAAIGAAAARLIL